MSVVQIVSVNHSRGRQIGPLLLLLLAATFGGMLFSGCASAPFKGNEARIQAVALRQELLNLGSSVDKDEATRLAETALEQSAALAAQYYAVRPAWFHNFLVNCGLRPRGLCYEWTNDLFPLLSRLGSKSLELHLAVSRMDTRREHNCIVVTARQQSFEEGLILDAWRRSGRLWFGRVATDAKHPWQPLPRDRVAPELEEFMPQTQASR